MTTKTYDLIENGNSFARVTAEDADMAIEAELARYLARPLSARASAYNVQPGDGCEVRWTAREVGGDETASQRVDVVSADEWPEA